MTFNIDRRSVTEGDIVEINWQCEGAESVTLTIDNGYRTTDIPLEINGTKRFRLNRSKGKTHLILAVIIMGKRYTKKINVRVKPMPTTRTETIDQQGRSIPIVKRWWQQMLSRWHGSKVYHAYKMLPETKQVIVKILLLLWLLIIISSIWPRITFLTLGLMAIYLTFLLVRRKA